MNLAQLHHLIALHESGSFSRAADRLHLTQPALSRSIQSLEAELGLPLIDRIGKRHEFTAFGQAVLARARRITFETDELKRSAQLLRGGLDGSIRMGMGSGPGSLLMQPLLGRMAREHPQIRIDIVQGPTAQQIEQLRARALDAAVVDTRAVVPAEDLHVEQLPDMRAGFLCRRGHPLLSLPAVTIDDLLRYPVASSPLSEEIARLLVEHYGPQAHPQRLVTLRCEYLPVLLQVVCESDAIYLGIHALAAGLLASGQLAPVPLSPAMGSATARYGIITLQGRTPPPALDIARRIVTDEIAAARSRTDKPAGA